LPPLSGGGGGGTSILFYKSILIPKKYGITSTTSTFSILSLRERDETAMEQIGEVVRNPSRDYRWPDRSNTGTVRKKRYPKRIPIRFIKAIPNIMEI
jgi:hypothetical protein